MVVDRSRRVERDRLREICKAAGFVETSFGWAAPPKEALPQPQCCEHCRLKES